MIAGLFNTITVALLGIGRLSRNWLLNRLAMAYVELFRNTPLLVQLFFWYFAVMLQLPNGSPQQPPIRFFGDFIVLTNGGLAFGGTVAERFGRLIVDGGGAATTGFSALVAGLAVFPSAFIAQVIRRRV